MFCTVQLTEEFTEVCLLRLIIEAALLEKIIVNQLVLAVYEIQRFAMGSQDTFLTV